VKTARVGIENLQGATGIVFGISPTRAETGYGYILAEKPPVFSEAWPVVRFIEKPDRPAAEKYLASGNYFWNSGMFLWSNRTLLSLYEKHAPEIHEGLRRLRPLIAKNASIEEIGSVFSLLPRISVDYAIMEKTSNLKLVPADFPWDDIGNWASLERALPSDAHGNIVRGTHVNLESKGCIVYARDAEVATFGVSDLIVVQAHGRVLVCPKDRAGDLKRLVSMCAPAKD